MKQSSGITGNLFNLIRSHFTGARVALSFRFMTRVTAAHAAIFTVSNTNESGFGSLRQAIPEANGHRNSVNQVEMWLMK